MIFLASFVHWRTEAAPRLRHAGTVNQAYAKERIMGKYFIAWLLGVPAFVLVLFYLFFH
ncbi:hypothetical protein QPK32_21215 [Massilia sp. YIM B02763]|uniref:hypothetical protein n=1 Tax=Massilia sp. YIM B02763 TaxID=3050130 RepID=UPI0025B6C240|nr:hypothetical protein [Massilia sp. YIM B02763]MDN4055594.1 hypothetical protein [Massilia sp. YIM B02763]